MINTGYLNSELERHDQHQVCTDLEGKVRVCYLFVCVLRNDHIFVSECIGYLNSELERGGSAQDAVKTNGAVKSGGE
jgi:hypothetical protein